MQSLEALQSEYESACVAGMKLDMSRGKPAPAQLDLAEDLLKTVLTNQDCRDETGFDCRNYGKPEGIPEARRIFAELLDISAENVIVCGNSSLNVMYDTIARGWCFGFGGCEPWVKQGKVKFLCPVPGYDRHFAITQHFGIEMINIPMTESGPDMNLVEQYVRDASVKGIWCVPKYSNPTGVTYSDETVRRFASLHPAAKDFRIFWDNAYCIHDLTDTPDTLLNILSEAQKQGSENMIFEFCSTSKITHAGGGISCIASGTESLNELLGEMKVHTIGFDKLTMLRHAKYLQNKQNILHIMKKQRTILENKFFLCDTFFSKELASLKGVSWTKPNGGYFINLVVPNGKAKRIVSLAREAGLVLTPAGASFPYGKDPDDANIRIAPTYPTTRELEKALELLCLCVKIACLE